jgi:hypothetical protein
MKNKAGLITTLGSVRALALSGCGKGESSEEFFMPVKDVNTIDYNLRLAIRVGEAKMIRGGAVIHFLDDRGHSLGGYHEITPTDTGYMAKSGAMTYITDESGKVTSEGHGYHEFIPTDDGYIGRIGTLKFHLDVEGRFMSGEKERYDLWKKESDAAHKQWEKRVSKERFN